MKTQIRLAQNAAEANSALAFLNNCNKNNQLEPWPYKQLLLPNSYLIVASQDSKLIGAISLFTESPLKLPLESLYDLNPYREHIGGRIGELSFSELENKINPVMEALIQYAIYFGSVYCQCNAFVTQAGRKEIVTPMGFAPLLSPSKLSKNESSSLFSLPSGEAKLDKDQFQFIFPEKSEFFNVYQYKQPETVRALLELNSRMLDSLDANAANHLRNIFAFSPYSSLFPDLARNYPITMKHPRFPLHCEGYLKGASGEQIDLTVQDISRLGLKFHCTDHLLKGEIVAITLTVGLLKKSEIIGRVVWYNEETNTAGVEVKSGDPAWQELIAHMDQNFKNEAA